MPEKMVSRRRSGSQCVNPLEKSNRVRRKRQTTVLDLKTKVIKKKKSLVICREAVS